MQDTNTITFFSQAYATFALVAEFFGFKDSLSFFIALIFLCIVGAFVAVAAFVLVKSRKQRYEKIMKVVEEVQKEPLEKIKVETLPKENLNFLPLALEKTKNGFIKKLSSFFTNTKEIDEDSLEEIESILFTADIGVKTANQLMESIKEQARHQKDFSGDSIRSFLKNQMKTILNKVKYEPKAINHKPYVIMFVGVNGAGKTTSIGKLGQKLVNEGKKIVFAAGDTFRAAAVEQLSIWGERVSAEVVKGNEGQDPASVLFAAVNKAKEINADVVLCDTAGRLHTKNDLMDELTKSVRVLNKAREGAPDEVYLVIDSTMGQNAIAQAKNFAESAPITGIILTKLDGTAKGGVALGIVDELNIPIIYIGVGEKASDLKPFNADDFVEELFA